MRRHLLPFLFSALPLFAQNNATISGHVLDAGTGQPVAGATVYADSLSGYDFSTTSGADGSYSFTNVASGEWYLQAFDGSRTTLWPDIRCGGPNNVLCGIAGDLLELAPGETRSDIDFHLSATDVPYGTVNGKVTGTHTAGFGVIFTNPATGLEYRRRATKFDGTFSLNLPPGDYVVMTNDGGPFHGVLGGANCLEPCPWIKTPVVSVAAGSTANLELVHPDYGVTSIEPDNGSPAGGTPFVLRGYWYDAGAMTVTFGSAATVATSMGTNAAGGFTPPGNGTVDVAVAAPRLRLATKLPNAFHYGESFLALSVHESPVEMGSDATLLLRIAPPRPAATVVALSNTNPERLSVPATVTIPANAESVTFTAHPLAYGGGRITATASGALPSSADVQVIGPRVTMLVPASAAIGAAVPVTITLDHAQEHDILLTLWAVSDAGIYRHDEILPAHQSTISFSVSDLPGSFELFLPQNVASGGAVASADIDRVNTTDVLVSTDAAKYTVAVGETRKAWLILSRPAADDVTFTMNVQSYPSDIVVVPPAVTVRAGQTAAEFTIHASGAGSAMIQPRTTASGIRSTANLIVQTFAAPSAPRRHAS